MRLRRWEKTFSGILGDSAAAAGDDAAAAEDGAAAAGANAEINGGE